MKLTENEPKERTFTLELSETELRVLAAATSIAAYAVVADITKTEEFLVESRITTFVQSARLLGVKP